LSTFRDNLSVTSSRSVNLLVAKRRQQTTGLRYVTSQKNKYLNKSFVPSNVIKGSDRVVLYPYLEAKLSSGISANNLLHFIILFFLYLFDLLERTNYLRPSPFLCVRRRSLVVGYRRFGSTCLSHPQGSSSPGYSKISVTKYEHTLHNFTKERRLISLNK
jgi:hypothetical protein